MIITKLSFLLFFPYLYCVSMEVLVEADSCVFLLMNDMMYLFWGNFLAPARSVLWFFLHSGHST